MDHINRLLDAAKEVTGSDYKTAKTLAITPSRLYDWRAGRQNPQPEDYALVAAIAGLDAEEHLVRAVLEKHKDTPKGERLMSALGNGLRAITEAGTSAFFVSVGFLALALGAIPTRADATELPGAQGKSRQCILCKIRHGADLH